MNILSILSASGEWHDYSSYIKNGGYGWSRNDIDSEKTTRTKDTKLRRDKLGTKRKLSYSMIPMPKEVLAQMDDDLSQATFTAKYDDLHGESTRTFYSSSLQGTLTVVFENGVELWQGASFSMIEV